MTYMPTQKIGILNMFLSELLALCFPPLTHQHESLLHWTGWMYFLCLCGVFFLFLLESHAGCSGNCKVILHETRNRLCNYRDHAEKTRCSWGILRRWLATLLKPFPVVQATARLASCAAPFFSCKRASLPGGALSFCAASTYPHCRHTLLFCICYKTHTQTLSFILACLTLLTTSISQHSTLFLYKLN